MITENGLAFIKRHEGVVRKAYRDPVGILTIGVGFTNRSAAVTRQIGRITPDMVLSHEEIDRVLRAVIWEEFFPAVERAMPADAKPHEIDAAVSLCFNCGPGAMGWKWAQAWRRGDRAEAGRLIRTTATTAQGRSLPGLVRRRAEEADLFLTANYHSPSAHGQLGPPRIVPGQSRALTPEEIGFIATWGDKLRRLGYAETTPATAGAFTKAVRQFQGRYMHLIPDGICGPATQAVITRALDARAKAAKVVIGTAAGGATGEAASVGGMGLPPGAAIGLAIGILLAGLGWLAWSYRDELLQAVVRWRAGRDA